MAVEYGIPLMSGSPLPVLHPSPLGTRKDNPFRSEVRRKGCTIGYPLGKLPPRVLEGGKEPLGHLPSSEVVCGSEEGIVESGLPRQGPSLCPLLSLRG